MKLKIFWAVLFTAIALAAGWNYSQSQDEIELSDLALANVEALARYELPDVEIICSGGSYGMCQVCVRREIYHPIYGLGYGYKCEKTGEQEDWCDGGCDSGGGGSFPG